MTLSKLLFKKEIINFFSSILVGTRLVILSRQRAPLRVAKKPVFCNGNPLFCRRALGFCDHLESSPVRYAVTSGLMGTLMSGCSTVMYSWRWWGTSRGWWWCASNTRLCDTNGCSYINKYIIENVKKSYKTFLCGNPSGERWFCARRTCNSKL